MVRLSPSPVPDVSPPPERSEEGKGSPKSASPSSPSPLQLALSTSTTAYHSYDTYIEDSLICLKHKIRNIEKKKLKLEDYKRRLKNGETLNKDQMDAVEKYDEVIHNLAFAKELQKTLGALTQDLLRSQRKMAKREQTTRAELERKRLGTVLQVHHVLQSLQREHVRKDLRSGANHAPFLPARDLEHLLEFAAMLGCKRDESMSLEDQMEQAANVYWDLMEGRDIPVAGTTYKHMKELLSRLMDCGYFERIPVPHSEGLEEAVDQLTRKAERLSKSSGSSAVPPKSLSANEVSTREFLNRCYLPKTDFSDRGQNDQTRASKESRKADLTALKEQEPPDSWDMEFADKPSSPPPTVTQKPWRGAATFVPKEQVTVQRPNPEPKQRREKSKGPQDKQVVKTEAAVEVFSSPSPLPQDPVLRKAQLQDLMEQIQGSFCFMQDSVLEREGSPTNGLSRGFRSLTRPSTPAAAPKDPTRSPVNSLSKALHSTPLPSRLRPGDGKIGMTNGDRSLNHSDLDLTADEVACENVQLSKSESLSSPSLYHRESILSSPLAEDTPSQAPVSQASVMSPCNGVANPLSHPPPPFSPPPSSHTLSMAATAPPFQTVHTVFKISTPLTPRSDSDLKPDGGAFPDSDSLTVATASTQTPPDFVTLDKDHLPVSSYPPESPVSNGCQVYLSPGQPGGSLSRSGPPYYTRSSARGMARGRRGLAHPLHSPRGHRGGLEGYRTGIRSPGGSFIPQPHGTREITPVLYGVQDTGYHQSYKRGSITGGQRNQSRAAWSDSSQVSSPERDGDTYASVDSGHGDSRCITPIDMPVAGQGPTLMPVHVYPIAPPMRVAFSAARTVNFTPGTLDQTIVFDLLHSNLGDTFDMHLGRFLCPVDGTYAFFFHILKLAINVPLYVNLMRNEEVMVSAYANDGAPDHETASNHAVLQLYQGDRIWLRLHRGAIYGSSWKYSTFSGYLLYQD
ncbi:caprin-2 isoform X3 [Anguilla anguilla]|uniref:caprin-2 isoform X3 n=1 Tax=Anguilla anguilla TaxID=7936 RepID=UPI0015B0E59F|nr:caprin-2 isoform X3 [Anguilla anguilla]